MAEMPPLDETLRDAIVRRFFEPQVVGVDYVPGPWVNGVQQLQAVPALKESPLASLARAMYQRNTDDLIDAIWARLDVGELADQIAAKTVEALLADPHRDTWSRVVSDAPRVKELRDMVNKRLADELTRRALAKLDEAEENDHA